MHACKIDNFLIVMICKTQKFLNHFKKKNVRVSDTLERSLFHSLAEKLMVQAASIPQSGEMFNII